MIENDLKRLTRLTAILIQLQSKKIITSSKLAEKFGVSSKTIYRDIKALENAGVPIFTEEGKGYSLMKDYRLPPIMFTEDEANALLTAELIIQSSKDSSLIKSFSEVISKVKAILPNKIKERNDRLEKQMGITNTFIDRSPKSKYLVEIQKALIDFAVISVDYTNKSGIASQRDLEPFAVFSNQNYEWVLVAYCRLRKEFRSFSLIGIENLKLTGEIFAPHQLSFEQYLKQHYSEANS